MKKINKKQKKNLAIFSGIIIAIFVLAGGLNLLFIGDLSVISGTEITNEIKQDTWSGIPLEVQASIFGSSSTGSGIEICGSTDSNDIIVNNEYSLDGTINLKSEISGNDITCGSRKNYIATKLTVPQGTMSGKCDTITSVQIGAAGSGPETVGQCIIRTQSEELVRIEDRACSPDSGSCTGGGVPGGREFSDTFSVDLAEETQIEILVTTTAHPQASAIAEITFDYEEFVPGQDYYRFSENKCVLIELQASEVTDLDFNTLSECESNIEKPFNFIPIIIIVVGLILIGLITWYFGFRRKR